MIDSAGEIKQALRNKPKAQILWDLEQAHNIFYFAICQSTITQMAKFVYSVGVTLIYKVFIGKIAEQKKLLDLTDKDIAKKTGYTCSTIRAFMCGVRPSDNVAKAIAAALKIEL